MEHNAQPADIIPRPTPVQWDEEGIALLWNAVQNWDEEGK